MVLRDVMNSAVVKVKKIILRKRLGSEAILKIRIKVLLKN